MGHHNLRFDGDRYSLHGAWSPSNSRANFCEEDYVVTFYLAEFINSLSNIAYVYLALKSLYGPESRGFFAPTWDFMSLTLLGLGIGSFLFHASLRATGEFSDELSMLALTWSMLQATLVIRQSPIRAFYISTALTVVFLSFTIFYIQSAKIIYQVVAFGFGIGFVLLRSQYLFHWLRPELPKGKSRDWNTRTWKAIGTCGIGYVLWTIDLEFCHELRNIREQVGLPWAWLFELHGWWHTFTAIGASQFMNVVREVRKEVHDEKSK